MIIFLACRVYVGFAVIHFVISNYYSIRVTTACPFFEVSLIIIIVINPVHYIVTCTWAT
jgi:hypothetical protein